VNGQDTALNTIWNAPVPGSENCLPIGTRLADFEITGIIGEGGFGIVYMAFDHALQRTVAIKEYMPGALAGRGDDQSVEVRAPRHQETFDAGLKSFMNEARLLAQFDHPALIKVHQFWEQNKTAYMAMRYYEGQTIKNIIKNNPELITEAWLKAMLKPILAALNTLYKVKILHRDISPDNIMIQKNGVAVLLDFGSAREIIRDMTQALTVILKPGYAPIEQYADDNSMKQGPWTDIYSLSAVIYSAIIKKPPPTSVSRMIDDPIELLQNGDYPGFSKPFLSAIDKGLCVRPEDRPQSISAFRLMLGIHTFTPSHAPIKSLPNPNRKKKSTKHYWGALIAGLLLTAGSIGYLSLRNNGTTTKMAPVAGNASTSASVAVTTPDKPVAVVPTVTPAPDAETIAWDEVKSSIKPEEVTNFIQRYPAGKYIDQARAKLTDLQAKQVPVPAPAPAAVTPVENPVAKNDALPQNTTTKPDETPVPVKSADTKPSAKTPVADTADIKADTPPADTPKTVSKADAAKAEKLKADKLKADAAKAEAAKNTGIVTLAVKPWANVIVDGHAKGVSPPLKRLVLPEGHHQIRFVNPNFPDYATEVDVSKKKPGGISYDFSPN
jgi:serine/threonine protein kinase